MDACDKKEVGYENVHMKKTCVYILTGLFGQLAAVQLYESWGQSALALSSFQTAHMAEAASTQN